MGLYARYLLPRLTDLAMRNPAVRVERARLLPLAEGLVLEVGVGSGLNIPFYGGAVRRLYALDRSAELLRLARARGRHARFPIEFLQHPAEAVPLAHGAIDCVVTTWTLCTIGEPVRALIEMRRVLRPNGRVWRAERSPPGWRSFRWS